MTPSWFNSVTRIAALELSAQSWIGTPFSANGRVKGAAGGTSCQKLAEAIYREAQFCDLETPNVSMSHAKHSPVSIIERFMNDQPKFRRIIVRRDEIRAGDLIGFFIFRTVHHVGVALSGGSFVHACDGAEVKISNLSDPTWGQRMGPIWRPLP